MADGIKSFVREKFKELFPDIYKECSDQKYLFDYNTRSIITYDPKLKSCVEFTYTDDQNFTLEVSKYGRRKKK